MLEMQKRTVQELENVTMVLPKATKVIHVLLRALRVHQWVKNLLIFVPLLASHNFYLTPSAFTR
jgi:hypothetical protein